MIHYKVQLKNNIGLHAVDHVVNENAKRYRVFWMANHCGMFIQYLISQHSNFPQSSAYYITLPNKSHVIYKTDGEDPDCLISPINNTKYTKYIDANPHGHEPWHMNNQADVQFYIEPMWELSSMRSDVNKRSTTEVDNETFMKSIKKIPANELSFCVAKLMDPETRAEEYTKLLNIIDEKPIEIDSMIEQFKKHIEWKM